MPVVLGRSPVMTLERDGLQSGAWQWALVNSVPARGQAVDVRRLRLRVPAEAADPVVQVVDGDEQDVELAAFRPAPTRMTDGPKKRRARCTSKGHVRGI